MTRSQHLLRSIPRAAIAAACLALCGAASAQTAATTVTTDTTRVQTTTTTVSPPVVTVTTGAPAAARALLKGGSAGMGDGEVTFEEVGDGVMVHVVAGGLAPGSTHGFHVHDKGVCAAPDFMSAGGHFNPTAHAHGGPDAERHAGDMPNVVADAGGRVDQRIMLHGSSLQGPDGLMGHAVVLHAAPDDYHTQPTGNSGPRVACGVIGG